VMPSPPVGPWDVSACMTLLEWRRRPENGSRKRPRGRRGRGAECGSELREDKGQQQRRHGWVLGLSSVPGPGLGCEICGVRVGTLFCLDCPLRPSLAPQSSPVHLLPDLVDLGSHPPAAGHSAPSSPKRSPPGTRPNSRASKSPLLPPRMHAVGSTRRAQRGHGRPCATGPW
jgi:hypothetical protein